MLRKRLIYVVVSIVGILLLVDIIVTRRNNRIIRKNKVLQVQIASIKSYYDNIGKYVIHSLDIGLRGYAIVRHPKFVKPMQNAIEWKDSIFLHVEKPLIQLKYKDLQEFLTLKDSINKYSTFCFQAKHLLDIGAEDDFIKIFEQDKGAGLWSHYTSVERNILYYLDTLNHEAQTEYEAALARNQFLQVMLFLICFPALVYSAIHTLKSYQLSELLRISEQDKNKMLIEQNATLEKMVAHRIQEIATQHEEMISQREELAAQRDVLFSQNQRLNEAQKIIEIQNQEINSKNAALQIEVENQTHDLKSANDELLKHNSQLEQFAFIAAHNLRAPLARILGLVNVIQISQTEEDKNLMLEKLVISTKDLDNVINDLNTILDIKKYKNNISEVDLPTTLNRVVTTLEKEVKETQATITYHFDEVSVIKAVAPYIESILYNLISNALKYRHPDRRPVISIRTALKDDFICLQASDNGLGIDLEKHRNNIFNLYKRFHLHVEGKGLGLYLIRTQMNALGGKIDVESVPEKGTTFFLYFKH